MSITALTQEVGFSHDAEASEKFRVLALFGNSRVLPKYQPTPQSGDTHRSPKVLRTNGGWRSLWSAVSITALTQEVGFSLDHGDPKGCARLLQGAAAMDSALVAEASTS